MSLTSLTTTFTPPSNCFNDWWYNSGAAVVLGPQSGYSSCYPPGWRATTKVYFSPGVCPTGYTSACGTFNSVGTVTETIVNCCPSGFDCVASSAGQQLQYPWWSTYSCTEAASGFTIPPTPLVVYSSGTPVETQTRTTNGGVNAYSIQVRYQSTDFRAITSPTSTSTSVTTSLTPTSSIISTSNGQSSSLSTGAQAGIGVAVGLAGLVLIVIGAFFLLRRLRLQRAIKNRKPDTVESRYGGVQSGKTELDATRAVQTMHYSEIDSNKDGTPWGQSTVPQELSAQPSVHELGTARSMRR